MEFSLSQKVFSEWGDQGKLKEVVELKKKYDFRLLVDDAHGFGTMGETGAGTGEAQGCQDGIDLYFSTFAKSMASIGAFISGEKAVIWNLRYNLRSQIYAKSLPMPIVIGNLKRLELLRSKPELKAKLWDNVNKLQEGFRSRGFDLGNTNSPVTPVFLKVSIPETINLVVDLRKPRHFCSAVTYPVIPKGMLMLRIIPTSSHSDEEIRLTLEAFEAIRKKLKVEFTFNRN